jgi:hypothetical protein
MVTFSISRAGPAPMRGRGPAVANPRPRKETAAGSDGAEIPGVFDRGRNQRFLPVSDTMRGCAGRRTRIDVGPGRAEPRSKLG